METRLTDLTRKLEHMAETIESSRHRINDVAVKWPVFESQINNLNDQISVIKN